jgi:ankyrin repeat protein
VKALLEGGASPYPNRGIDPLALAAEVGSVEMIQMLLDHGDHYATDLGLALETAATYGNQAAFDLLLENGASLGYLESLPQRALAEAAENGYLGIIRRLAQNGVDLNTPIGVEAKKWFLTAMSEAIAED